MHCCGGSRRGNERNVTYLKEQGLDRLTAASSTAASAMQLHMDWHTGLKWQGWTLLCLYYFAGHIDMGPH